MAICRSVSFVSEQVDVRPALDTFSDLADRLVMMPLARLMGKSNFDPLPLLPSPTMKSAVSVVRNVAERWRRVIVKSRLRCW